MNFENSKLLNNSKSKLDSYALLTISDQHGEPGAKSHVPDTYQHEPET